MAKINSRSKGKRGELELSKELQRLFGVDCRRGQQFSGLRQGRKAVIHLYRVCKIRCFGGVLLLSSRRWCLRHRP